MNLNMHPKFSKSVFLAIIVMTLFTTSCVNTKSPKSLSKSEEDHKAIVINTNVKTIDSKDYKIVVDLLYGKWDESIIWVKNNDLSRTGIRYIVKRTEYDFFNDGEFRFKEFIRDSIVHSSRGKFNLIEDGNKIELLCNLRNDMEFNEGDTIRRALKKFHLLNDSLLRIEGDPYTNPQRVIIEYKRK